MADKPVIFSVDDDPNVLRAVVRDLRGRYGERYRILRAESGRAALEAVNELNRRHEAVALFVADQRMPEMNGIEFLAAAMRVFPDAKRALLTAYADTDAAINAINTVSAHYYLLKPWDPPEEKLFPVLDDLLEDWLASYHPPFEGIRIVGHRWSPEAHEIKEFLARNQVPYLYLDLEFARAEAQEALAQYDASLAALPLVVFPDGSTMVAPSASAVAARVGLHTQAGKQFYDLAIVGGGPGGLAAAVYGASEGLNTVMIERHAPGGQAGTSSRIENYLGFPSGLSGADLARRATTQAKRFGVEILAPQEAVGLGTDGPYRMVQLADGSEIVCHAVVVAVGLTYLLLEAPGVDKLTGAGVYYGASLSEVPSCQDQPVFVVGAGNSAGQAALYLAQFASKVIMVVRGDTLEARMSQYLVDRIFAHPQIEVKLRTEVLRVEGGEHVETITTCDRDTREESTYPAAALFIFIGAVPRTGWLAGTVDLDEHGYVIAGPDLIVNGRPPKAYWPLDRDPYLFESSVPGVFAVGDVRANSVKRVASAVGEGSVAVQFIHRYLARVK
jgi:thioredoxin reductase (NADPH)